MCSVVNCCIDQFLCCSCSNSSWCFIWLFHRLSFQFLKFRGQEIASWVHSLISWHVTNRSASWNSFVARFGLPANLSRRLALSRASRNDPNCPQHYLKLLCFTGPNTSTYYDNFLYFYVIYLTCDSQFAVILSLSKIFLLIAFLTSLGSTQILRTFINEMWWCYAFQDTPLWGSYLTSIIIIVQH